MNNKTNSTREIKDFKYFIRHPGSHDTLLTRLGREFNIRRLSLAGRIRNPQTLPYSWEFVERELRVKFKLIKANGGKWKRN